MPKYTCRDLELYEGVQPLPFWPCDVRDANGNVLNGRQFYIDTDSGITISSVDGEYGPNSIKMNREGTSFIELVELHPAPLTIIPYDPANHITPIIVGGS